VRRCRTTCGRGPRSPAEKPFEDEAEPNATLATPPKEASIVRRSREVQITQPAFPPSADLLIIRDLI
jgi:hypothetical protein